MANKPDTEGSNAPELSDTADAIARGRELLKHAQSTAEAADRQASEAQASAEETKGLVERANELLDTVKTLEDPNRNP